MAHRLPSRRDRGHGTDAARRCGSTVEAAGGWLASGSKSVGDTRASVWRVAGGRRIRRSCLRRRALSGAAPDPVPGSVLGSLSARWSRWAWCSSTGPTASSTSPRATSARWPPSSPRRSSWARSGRSSRPSPVGLVAALVLGVARRGARHPSLRQGAPPVAHRGDDRHAAALRLRPARPAAAVRLRHRAAAAGAVRLRASAGSRSRSRGGHLLIIIVVPIVAVGLTAFFRCTRVGIAVRAVGRVGRPRRAARHPGEAASARSCGCSPPGSSGSACSCGCRSRASRSARRSGPSLLLRALAAAVIGRMENLRVTFVAALVLGMIEQAVLLPDPPHARRRRRAVLRHHRRAAAATARHDDARRGDGASTWTATREVRPDPRELRGCPRSATVEPRRAGGLSSRCSSARSARS